MHELKAAMARHTEMADEIKALEQTELSLRQDIAYRDGRIAEITLELAEITKDRDYYLRWAIETTKRIFDIGLFVNETINAARGVVGNQLQATLDPAKTETILKGIEEDIMKRPPKKAPQLAHPRNLDREPDAAE